MKSLLLIIILLTVMGGIYYVSQNIVPSALEQIGSTKMSSSQAVEEIQPVTLRPKERILVEEWLDKTIHFKFRGKYLKTFILPERPRKVSKQPAILTTHPLNWKPPPNHPWRRYKEKILP